MASQSLPSSGTTAGDDEDTNHTSSTDEPSSSHTITNDTPAEACLPRRHSEGNPGRRPALYVRCPLFPDLMHRLSSHAVPLCLAAHGNAEDEPPGPAIVVREERQPYRREESFQQVEDGYFRLHRRHHRHSAPAASSSPRGEYRRRALGIERDNEGDWDRWWGHDGRLVFTQITVADLDRAQAFYEAVFGWRFAEGRERVVRRGLEGAYEVRLFGDSEDGCAGAVRGSMVRYLECEAAEQRTGRQGVVCFIEADDMEDAMSRVEAAGGTVVTERWADEGMPVELARFVDTEGNEFGLVRRRE